MTKYLATAIAIDDNSSNLMIIIDRNDKLKLFTNERQAEAYIKKEYSSCVIFYGLIPDPTNAYKKLRKNYLKINPKQ